MLSAEELKRIFVSEFNPEFWKRIFIKLFGVKICTYNHKRSVPLLTNGTL